MALHLTAQPQNETPPGIGVQVPGLRSQHGRTTGKRNDHGRGQLHPIGRQRRDGQRGKNVVAKFHGHDGIETRCLGLPCCLGHFPPVTQG